MPERPVLAGLGLTFWGDAMLTALLVTDRDGRCLDVSPTASQLLGYTREELLGRRLAELIAAGPPWMQLLEYQPEEFWEGRLDLRRPDGSVIALRAEVIALPRAVGGSTLRLCANSADPSGMLEPVSTILERITDAFFALDREGRFTYINSTARHVFQVEASEQLLGKSLWQLFPQAAGSIFQQQFERALAQQVSVSFDARSPFSKHWYSVRAYPAPDGLSVYFQDVTERKQAELHQRFLEQASQLLGATLDYEATLVGIARAVVPDLADWCFVDVLEEGRAIRRVAVTHADPAREPLLWEVQRRFPPTWHSPQPAARAMMTGTTLFLREITDATITANCYNADHAALMQQLGPRSSVIAPMIARSQVLGAITLAFAESGRRYEDDDVTLIEDMARRAAVAVDNARLYEAAQVALRQRDQALAEAQCERVMLRDLFTQAPALICYLRGPAHVFDFANPRYLEYINHRDVIGKSAREAFPDEDSRPYLELLDQVYASGEPFLGSETQSWIERNGTGEHEEAFFNFVFQPTRDIAGAVDGILIHAVDVTEQVRARREIEALAGALAEQREWFRITLSSIGDAVIATDTQGCITFMNTMAQELTGWSDEEAAGRALPEVFRIVNEETRATVANPITRVLQDGVIVGLANHTLLINKDGRDIPIDDSGAPIRDGAGQVVGAVLVFRDIAERRRTETALMHRMRSAVLGAEIGAALVQAAPLPQILQRCSESLVRHLDAALARIWTFNAEAQVLELHASAGMYTHTDGPHSRVPLGQFKIGLIAEQRRPHLTNQVLGDERVHDQDWARREGLVAFAGYPLEVEGRLVGIMAIFSRHRLSDITLQTMATVANEIALGIERKYSDERQRELLAREQAARAEAEQALNVRNQFLSIAAHELRTPVTALLSYSQLLQRRLESHYQLQARDQRSLQALMDQTRRLNRLSLSLLDVGRIQAGRLSIERASVDLVALIRRLLDEIQPALERHTLEWSSPVDSLQIQGDELRLEQAVQNLVQNAVKYSPYGGTVSVRLERRNGDVCLEVRDQGIGIPQDALPKLFRQFYRAENVQAYQISGMGVGLYLVKEIVSLHGGRVAVSSHEGQGSTFEIFLPATDAAE